MGKTSAKVINRYKSRHYDNVSITIPKGWLAEMHKVSDKAGMSLNQYVIKMLRERVPNLDDPAEDTEGDA